MGGTRYGIAAVVLALALVGCAADLSQTSAEAGPSDQPSPADTEGLPASRTPSAGPATGRASPTAAGRPAAELLASLPIKGRAPLTGYEREAFAWRADTDRNGCDTRNDILARDLTGPAFRAGTGGCVVVTGVLHDRYTGDTVSFHRQRSTVDIDHVVALANAWQTGAAAWDPAKRVAFANDPLNLLAVGSGVNRAKGDGDAATWLPPNRSFRCGYVAHQVAVKAKYRLWVTPAEHDAIARVLARCPDQQAPAGDAPTRAPGFPTTSTASGSVDPRFGTCAQAKAAGYGPYRRGVDPEYDWYRDADTDGLNCE